MLKKKQLNKEPFDTLFRLSRIASRSKNYIETNLIDEILLKKAKENSLSIGECYLKHFDHINSCLKLKNLNTYIS